MKRWTLRRRVYSLLLQWFLLFLVTSGIVTVFALARFRRSAVDERLLLARTVAHYLDSTVSEAAQNLDRLLSRLASLDDSAHNQLRAFRFQSPFDEAIYLLDGEAAVLVADPDDTHPLPADELSDRATVTPLVYKTGETDPPTLAIVRPFRRNNDAYFLVAEMDPVGSVLSQFLRDLATDPDLNIAVVDDAATVIASSKEELLFRTLPEAELIRDRIWAKRPLSSQEIGCTLCESDQSDVEALTVMVPLRFARWGVIVQQRHERAFSALYASQYGFLLAGILLAITGVFLARALSRSVVDPIRRLSVQAELLRRGELSSPLAVEGDHEIEVLASTLDEARKKLSTTLTELQALNEDLEGEVRNRTQSLRVRYEDLRLLHTVAQISTQEREPDKFIPPILRALSEHYSAPAVALVTSPPDTAAVVYTYPQNVSLPWLSERCEPPSGWESREILHQGKLQARLLLPEVSSEHQQVMESLEHQLAVSLHGSYLWNRTLEQDRQRRVLVRRLLDATEEERRRIARELHDETAQLLTVIQLSLDGVPETAEIKKVKPLLRETQDEIHRIIYDLRPSLLDDLGLAAALKSYASDRLIARGLQVSFEVEDDLTLRPEIQIATFRIYQEIVTNILRHASAESVSIELYETGGQMILAVEDDGIGFSPSQRPEGVGMVGMRERAALVNGTIRFDSEAGMGTSVILTIPLDELLP